MRCPIDGTELMMSDRAGVEIDYCPKCRGAWLDRGELDKIIERSAPATPQPARPAPGKYHGGYSDSEYRGYKKKKKRGGFLDEIFDF